MPEPTVGVNKEDLLSRIYKSDRPYILLNFFDTQSAQCRAELPDLVSIERDTTSEIRVVLVSVDTEADVKTTLHNYLGEFGVDFQTYASPTGFAKLIKEFWPGWDGRVPLTLLYHRDGNLLEHFKGTDRGEIELLVNKHKTMGS